MMIDVLLSGWEKQLLLIGQMTFAALLGGVVGFERELANRPAGLRTHMLLAAAVALLVGLTDLLAEHFTSEHGQRVAVDPVRIIEAVVTAVAFLGAGTIFRRSSKDAVAGLTTAASMLMVAVVAIAVGLNQYILGVGATLLSLLVLRLLYVFERWHLEGRRR